MNNTFNDLMEFLVQKLNSNIDGVKFRKYLLEREKYLPLRSDLCIVNYKNINSASKIFSDYLETKIINDKKNVKLARQFKGVINFDFYSKTEEDCYEKLNYILEYLTFSKELDIIDFNILEVKNIDNQKLCNMKFEAGLMFTLVKSVELDEINELRFNAKVIEEEMMNE